MKNKRIVVTGMGVVSCLGHDVETFYQALLNGQSGVKTIEHFPTEGLTTQFAASIPQFDVESYIDKKQARRVDKFIAFGIVAGKKALAHAGLGQEQLAGLNKQRCGILIGSGIGGIGVFTEGARAASERAFRKISPFFIPYTLTNMAGGLLAIDVGFMGPNYSISTACATGNNAIIAAASHIRSGHADLILCGGTEAPVNPVGVGGFCALRALSQRNEAPEKASRPWNRGRDGFVMGEGAGVLVLESLEHALQRGATIYAEYLGGGISCDAHHMTELREDGEGLVLCMQNALREAGVNAEQIDYVNAHATSTPQGDMVEIRALQKLLPDPRRVLINATKSMTGHALGAAGGLEAIVTVMALHSGKIHPTLNFEDPEPEILFQVPTKAASLKARVALSNSFGFGGHNASVIFAPYA